MINGTHPKTPLTEREEENLQLLIAQVLFCKEQNEISADKKNGEPMNRSKPYSQSPSRKSAIRCRHHLNEPHRNVERIENTKTLLKNIIKHTSIHASNLNLLSLG